MVPKQREMDGIVREIYTAMEIYSHLDSTLLVLCGDHGMNEAGNHGGASPGETSPALTFISPKFQALHKRWASPETASGEFQYYETVVQSDIAPTLAGLLGFPVPMNNLGVFIPEFLSLWGEGKPPTTLSSRHTNTDISCRSRQATTSARKRNADTERCKGDFPCAYFP